MLKKIVDRLTKKWGRYNKKICWVDLPKGRQVINQFDILSIKYKNYNEKEYCKRMVEMKQKRRVSMIGALVLIISAVSLITGCPQSNGGTITRNIVEFDSASIKCRNISTSTDIHNGDSIQEKDLLQCKAILPSGKVVENWYINDAKQEYETNSEMLYRVKASDIASGKLKISVVFK